MPRISIESIELCFPIDKELDPLLPLSISNYKSQNHNCKILLKDKLIKLKIHGFDRMFESYKQFLDLFEWPTNTGSPVEREIYLNWYSNNGYEIDSWQDKMKRVLDYLNEHDVLRSWRIDLGRWDNLVY